LPNNTKDQCVFIAGGIGITPFLSMIKEVYKKNNPTRITLIYANKNEDSSAYLNELRTIDSTLKNFLLDEVFGSIDINDIQRHIRDINNTSWWVVGPPGMVVEVKHLLEYLGIPSSKIRTEEFTGYWSVNSVKQKYE